jgi:hypothetical protein
LFFQAVTKPEHFRSILDSRADFVFHLNDLRQKERIGGWRNLFPYSFNFPIATPRCGCHMLRAFSQSAFFYEDWIRWLGLASSPVLLFRLIEPA